MEHTIKALNTSIKTFCDTIAKRYNLNSDEIYSMWSGENTGTSSKPNSPSKNLDKMSKAQLVDMCKERGLKVSGTKSDLVARLNSEVPVESKRSSPVAKSPTEEVSQFMITKNKFGNWVHEPSQLVFLREEKRVIGKQLEDGSISKITKEVMELCHKYKFRYDIPDNLNDSEDEEDVEEDADDAEEDAEEDDEIEEEEDMSDYYEEED